METHIVCRICIKILIREVGHPKCTVHRVHTLKANIKGIVAKSKVRKVMMLSGLQDFKFSL